MAKPKNRPKGLKTVAEIATEFGVTIRQVRRWLEEDDCPVAVKGGPGRRVWLNSDAIRAWRGPKEASNNVPVSSARLKTAQAEKVEQEVLFRRGQLVERALVVRLFGEAITHAKARILAGPSALAARSVEVGRTGGPPAVQALWDTWLRDVLGDLAVTLPDPA